MERADAKVIQEEICANTYDSKYGKIRWIDLYFRDKDVFLAKAKAGGLSTNTVSFFESNVQALANIRDTISINFFREQQCMELVDKFCTLQEKPCTNRIKPRKIKANSMPAASLKVQQSKKAKVKLDQASYCSKLIEILVLKTRKRELQWDIRFSDDGVRQCIEYATKNLWSREKIKEVILVIEMEDNWLIVNRKKRMKIGAHACEYLKEAIRDTKIQATPQKRGYFKEQRERKLREYRKSVAEGQRLEKEKEKKEQEKQTQEKRMEKHLHKSELKAEKKLDLQRPTQKSTVEQKQQLMNFTAQARKTEALAQKKIPQRIDAKDFVIRRSVFRCTHEQHKIEDLDAGVEIIDKAGNVRLITVSAGYCPNCKVFFIMESSYENLKKRGIPICRVSDEKTYLKSNFTGSMTLAQESILMQYGYNVSQTEGLTGKRRHKILAVLIDKDIMSKSEIIGYLDFFIRQRQSSSKFKIAISKWENDREFVENYRTGEFRQYDVRAIQHR